MPSISFFDLETEHDKDQINDIGSIRWDGATYHGKSISKFIEFIQNSDFVCGHNIFNHDLKHLQAYKGDLNFWKNMAIDTLHLSPLLFPSWPYHALLKDDKLQFDELNNPLHDAMKTRDLFHDEVNAFYRLEEDLKIIFYNLLGGEYAFAGFFKFINYNNPITDLQLSHNIRTLFSGKICATAPIEHLINKSSVSLAYALALINTRDNYSVTPPWVLKSFPDVDRVIHLLRGRPCLSGCQYCNSFLDPFKGLKRFFNFDKFRIYDGEPLQENAVRSAIQGKSLLAVFPTGGGKSITFQLPALMAGENEKALTVVISPLQSLMKDQVDNLESKYQVTTAVTINRSIDPIEKQQSIERVSGTAPEKALANILYLSPESLRSNTIEKLLLGRKIARFVIDEAHCLSSWGQDFRVDYLYIGDFIKNLQKKKGLTEKIPVSCFTATAKQKVIEDIRLYFKEKLHLDLELFSSNASRTNLQYKVFNKEDEDQKYAEVRRLLETKNCPTIIYVSRTKKAVLLAKKLHDDGFTARAYHGKMEKDEKKQNQDSFLKGETDIMVATSAFGMGVDKEDVGMVIHYEISDSLENYVQEAGRAGRKENITADCYVLFNEGDLDKHFLLLNQTRLGIEEIKQVWKAIKDLTRTRDKASNSALEIARKAGWDDSIKDIETRVTTAIAALEDAGYVKRGQNMPRLFANSILSKTAQDAIAKINASDKFKEGQKEKAARIIKKLFSSKSKGLATEETAESRIDYISDHLNIPKYEVIEIVQLLRDEKILADAKDLTAYIKRSEQVNRSLSIVENYSRLEIFLLAHVEVEEGTYNIKEINELAIEAGCRDSSPNKITTVVNFWAIRSWMKKKNSEHSKNHIEARLQFSKDELAEKMEKRHILSKVIIEHLFSKLSPTGESTGEEILVDFSIYELKEVVERSATLFKVRATNEDIEDSLFYLSRIEALKIEGGFMVIYNKLTIERLERNNKIQYKADDYRKLDEFYKNKVQQIHIVGEYAKKMVENYKDALKFVDDYFKLNYTSFLNKYFPGSRQDEIKQRITPAKFQQLFGALSPSQLEIIKDIKNRNILVVAGPGSGKTRVLVHKLAALLLTEDIKPEQLLMLTFSRASATEFKKRLLDLIHKTAHYVDIKTFHSYCFDLLGKVGDIEHADNVIKLACDKVKNRDVEISRITKTVLVVDEAQDISEDEYQLLQLLTENNEEIKVIFVGDDDQNIYEFRKSSSRYMLDFLKQTSAKQFELIENYRSRSNIVGFANQWVQGISNRLKHLPIVAKNTSSGEIKIVEYTSGHLITPLVSDIQKADLSGSTCVLTRTNEEAEQITGLLINKGHKARLIQNNDSFKLYALKELRWFTNLINNETEGAVVDKETWLRGKQELINQFAESDKLSWCNIIIRDFEAIHPERKYKSDWKTFLDGSKFEDFVEITGDTIYVSTMHKAKGKEFDNVFIMLNQFNPKDNETKRLLYVAFTRAKANLTIHYNETYLRNIIVNNLSYSTDNFIYNPPQLLSVHLVHGDVQLWYFHHVQHRLKNIYSGAELTVSPEGVLNSKKDLTAKFSNRFSSRINSLISQGYMIEKIYANYLVHWWDEQQKKEVEILLPEITFIKKDLKQV